MVSLIDDALLSILENGGRRYDVSFCSLQDLTCYDMEMQHEDN